MRNEIAAALLEARKMTEKLILSKKPSNREISYLDALLKRAIEIIDSPDYSLE